MVLRENWVNVADSVDAATMNAIGGEVNGKAPLAHLVVSVKDYGAVGNNSTDDTAAIQAAINAAAARGAYDGVTFKHGFVFLPAGKYVISNITVPTDVTLQGDMATLTVASGTTGYMVTLSAGMFGGLRNIRIGSDGVADVGGVHVASGRYRASIRECSIDFFRRRAVYVEGGDLWIDGCFLEGWRGSNSALATYSGVLEFAAGGNDAMVSNTEINGCRFSALGPTSVNLYACGLVINGGGNNMFTNIILENADTGVYITNSANNRLSGVRSELNYGHGFFFDGGEGRLSDCQALDNSKNGDNLYDGFHFTADATNYQCSNLVSMSTTGSALKHRYGFYDNGTFAATHNEYVGCRSYGDHLVFSDISGARVGGPQHSFPSAGAAISITGATPDITARTWLRAGDSSTITNFLGTVPGQLFYVLGNGTASVANNANIVTATGAATVLVSGRWYTFLKHDGVHTEVDLSGKLSGKVDKTAIGNAVYVTDGSAISTVFQWSLTPSAFNFPLYDASGFLKSNAGNSSGNVVTVDGTQTETNKTLTSPVINTPTGIVKGDVGLGNVDNTADTAKNVLSATKLTTGRNINGVAFDGTANITVADATKEPTIAATTSADYWRGDKTFQTLNKAAVGLGNVDNTADTAKPVSTAQQTALNLKANLSSPTFTGTVAGITKSMVGLGNADNTADTAKPVSTAQQTALDAKVDKVAYGPSVYATDGSGVTLNYGWSLTPAAYNFPLMDADGALTVKAKARIGTVASSATPTINTDIVDQFNITALAVAITSMTSGLSGTPTDGQHLRIRITSDATPRAITWGASFVGNLLATTVASKTHIQELVYDAAAAKWAGTYVDTAGY